ncbi:MAG: hypothetical protein LUG12_00210 [Erysipelotrichaceae bacterium]|nr:hypothetical protein [Erysipelotrichaceae bacterium]
MILNSDEAKTCLWWGINPFLKKYHMHINELYLKLHQFLIIEANIEYASNIMHIQGTCDISYQEKYLIFKDIKGTVDYLFISLNLLSLLQQYIHDEHMIFYDNNIYYQIDLPIKQLIIEDKHLNIKLDEM